MDIVGGSRCVGDLELSSFGLDLLLLFSVRVSPSRANEVVAVAPETRFRHVALCRQGSSPLANQNLHRKPFLAFDHHVLIIQEPKQQSTQMAQVADGRRRREEGSPETH